MKIQINHLSIHQTSRVDEMRLLKRLELLLGSMNMKINELVAKVTSQAEVAEKVVTEIQALKAALENVDLPQDAVDALTRLDAALSTADELNPDAPQPAPAEEATV